jgi:hypothetical protein
MKDTIHHQIIFSFYISVPLFETIQSCCAGNYRSYLYKHLTIGSNDGTEIYREPIKDTLNHTSKDTLKYTSKDTLKHTSKDTLKHTSKDTLKHTSKDTLQHTSTDTLQHTSKDMTIATTTHTTNAICRTYRCSSHLVQICCLLDSGAQNTCDHF